MKNSKITNYLILVIFILVLSFALYYVNKDNKVNKEKDVEDNKINNEVYGDFEMDIEAGSTPIDMQDEVKITINNIEYILKLEKNETSFDIISMLPMNLEMDDLNNNEKYVYLSSSLNSDGNYTGSIKKGDVMLYQNNCLVIFYKDFNTNYYYTKIGHIDNLPDFDNESINVVIE